jgi:hypothetical protein
MCNSFAALIGCTVIIGLFQTAVVAGTAGTLVLLIAYLMAALGSIHLLFFTWQSAARRWKRSLVLMSPSARSAAIRSRSAAGRSF